MSWKKGSNCIECGACEGMSYPQARDICPVDAVVKR